MKMRKLLVVSAALIMILGLVVVVPVHAQVTLDSWVGKWFKGAEKNKGLLVNNSGTLKSVEKLSSYATVKCWDDNTGEILATMIQLQNGNWEPIQFLAKVLGGVDANPLDYVSYALVPPGFFPDIEALLVVLSATGKEKGGELVGGKVQTVGGSVIYNNIDGSYPQFATSESLKMKMIPDGKVPPEVITACDTLCDPSPPPCVPGPGPE